MTNVQYVGEKKSMTVSDNSIVVRGSGDFFKNLGKKGLLISKKMARNVLKNPGRALETGANVGSEFGSRSPKAALTSLPEVINFDPTGKNFNLLSFFYNFLKDFFFSSKKLLELK